MRGVLADGCWIELGSLIPNGVELLTVVIVQTPMALAADEDDGAIDAAFAGAQEAAIDGILIDEVHPDA